MCDSHLLERLHLNANDSFLSSNDHAQLALLLLYWSTGCLFFRLQSTSDNKLRAYIAQGEVLPVATRSFGAIGIFAIPEMGRFYRHVLIEKNFPHHGAVAFGNFGKALFEVFKYIGVPVDEIGYNQPKEVRYPTENPWR